MFAVSKTANICLFKCTAVILCTKTIILTIILSSHGNLVSCSEGCRKNKQFMWNRELYQLLYSLHVHSVLNVSPHRISPGHRYFTVGGPLNNGKHLETFGVKDTIEEALSSMFPLCCSVLLSSSPRPPTY